MKSERKIFMAFILNLSFSVFEVVGGILTGSVAIISDSIHDLGDAVSIGISYLLEKKSQKQPDKKYTYGYTRYSVFGSVISTLILLSGSLMVIFNGINRLIHPITINYNGMIILAVIGVCVNTCAVFFTRNPHSLNQKSVNLHMLEDVLGWVVVLIGAFIMKFTELTVIDPILSIGVSVFILIKASQNLKESMGIFLEKAPNNINIDDVKECVTNIKGVSDVHHIHIWSMDGQNSFATMHVVTNNLSHEIKEKIREELYRCGIAHVTLEQESENEQCHNQHCNIEFKTDSTHHHHH